MKIKLNTSEIDESVVKEWTVYPIEMRRFDILTRPEFLQWLEPKDGTEIKVVPVKEDNEEFECYDDEEFIVIYTNKNGEIEEWEFDDMIMHYQDCFCNSGG